MHSTRPRRLISALLAALCVVPASATAPGPTREWRFNVSLDGSPIGYHRFALSERGAMTAARFVISGSGRDTELASCVQTFAYWNPQILRATHLLNPQTGKYVPVRVEYIGAESLTVRGVPQASEHYRLAGDASVGAALRIDLWYSPSREWLALESTTADGRRFHYQLQ